jgi:hypothetical protein
MGTSPNNGGRTKTLVKDGAADTPSATTMFSPSSPLFGSLNKNNALPGEFIYQFTGVPQDPLSSKVVRKRSHLP